MAITETPEFLTVAEAAAYLRVSEPTVYRRVHDGTLPAVRIGEAGPVRIPFTKLRRWLELADDSDEGVAP